MTTAQPTAQPNPFRPSFGVTPQVPAGRQSTTLQVRLALSEGPGSPFRFTLISGTRGSGKTVLLNMLEAEAREAQWHVVRVPASADMLHEMTHQSLPRLLQQLDPKPTSTTVTGGGIASVGSISTESREKYPAEHSLRSLLKQAAQLAQDSNSGIFLTMDELQSARIDDLHQLSDTIQDCVRDELPVALSVAGLPAEISELLQHPGTTFLRRAIPVDTEHIPADEVQKVLQETAALGGKRFDPGALDAATEVIDGYAFMTQLVGSIAFSITDGEVIKEQDVQHALPLAQERIGLQVHQPALKVLPDRELEYLVAMLEHSRTGEVASAMGIPANQQSTYQRRLKDRGLIRSPRYGHVDYALPFLREYVREHYTS